MARTFWMRVFAVTNWVAVALVLYLLSIFVLPDVDNPETAPFLFIFGIFLVLFVIVAVAATFWSGAPRRPWFWVAGVIPAVLLVLLNAPYLPYALTHPGDVQGFTAALPLVVSAVVAVMAGWFSFRDARAQSAATTPTQRAAMALTIAVAATLGAVATAFLGTGGGGATAAEVGPTSVVEIRDVKFVQEAIDAKSGETLGVVVVNHDAFAHSFDIDALGIHVPIPANSSALVAVTPKQAGDLKFYCSIPGHDATMNGVVQVP